MVAGEDLSGHGLAKGFSEPRLRKHGCANARRTMGSPGSTGEAQGKAREGQGRECGGKEREAGVWGYL